MAHGTARKLAGGLNRGAREAAGMMQRVRDIAFAVIAMAFLAGALALWAAESLGVPVPEPLSAKEEKVEAAPAQAAKPADVTDIDEIFKIFGR